MRTLSLLALCLLGLLTACKENDDIADYRDDIIGTYQLRKVGHIWNGPMNYQIDTTITTQVIKSGDASIVVLGQTLPLLTDLTFGHDASGSCAYYPVSAYRIFCGHFRNDSLFVSTSEGGLGIGQEYQYSGKKQ